MIVFVNDRILATPFVTMAVETKVNKGFGSISQKRSLSELTVLEDAVLKDETLIKKGSVILVEGEDCKSSYASLVIDFNGKDAILVPFDRVVAVRKEEAE